MIAISALQKKISQTNYLVPYLNSKDKGPSWDGEIYVYGNPDDKHPKSDLIGKVPVQIKGHKAKQIHKEKIKFQAEVSDLRNYLKDGGVIYFVVYFDENGENECIYYVILLPFELKRMLKNAGNQKTKTIVLGIELYCTDLQKFIDAQDHGYGFGETYQTALAEMKQGEKFSCWMWYVFPQIQGLGLSGTTAYFSIKDLSEAKDYYAHPILGARLKEITETLLDIESDDPMAVFGYPDAFKLRSCMTLFKHAASEQELFQMALDKFCRGNEDEETIRILGV